MLALLKLIDTLSYNDKMAWTKPNDMYEHGQSPENQVANSFCKQMIAQFQ